LLCLQLGSGHITKLKRMINGRIQLYTEVREERDELIAKLACVRMGIPLDNNEPSWEENDERMDIIGQNGNEGTHYANVKTNDE